MFTIIGLGNPGPRYENTRHNMGFKVVDIIASQAVNGLGVGHVNGSASSLWKSQKNCLVNRVSIGNTEIVLLKPQALMNLSGEAAAPVINYYKLSIDNIIVVHDELDLPCGVVRSKKGGSAAGHRGVEDLITHLSSREFRRIRIGIGRPEDLRGEESNSSVGPSASRRPSSNGDEIVSWVLGVPSPTEKPLLERGCNEAANLAVSLVLGRPNTALTDGTN